ncbi:MAG: hypothetical protein C0483_02370 [Pirellula sp.]|nr:hypothetical protein [Pirellula sp.]
MSIVDDCEPIHFLGLRFQLNRRRRGSGYDAYLVATTVAILCTLLSWTLQRVFGVQNGFLVFLLGVAVVAVVYGTAPSVWASCISTALLAFFFMPPIFSFAVSDIQHVFTLLVMATIGIVISNLTSQVMHQADVARSTAKRFEALYRLSRELADLAGSEHLIRATVRHIESVVGGMATVLLPDPRRGFRPIPAAPLAADFRAREWSAARAAFDARTATGLGTHTTPNVTAQFLPLALGQNAVGVLAARPPDGHHDFTEEQHRMLLMLANQLTGALERDRLSHQIQTAQDEMENERMRAALLSSVSHDLRTPLAVIAGASSTLLDAQVHLTEEARRSLQVTIFDNANRLSRIVDNLLNMTRIESGVFKVAKQSHVLEEVVGSTLRSMTETLQGRRIEVRIPADLPLVPMDEILFQQVLINLLDNAQKYSPKETPIELAAAIDGERLRVDVSDHGTGIAPGEESRVFDKFFRGAAFRNDQLGSGLGLTICRAIVAAHGGSIAVENRPEGGARFRLWLPVHSAAATELASPQLIAPQPIMVASTETEL